MENESESIQHLVESCYDELAKGTSDELDTTKSQLKQNYRTARANELAWLLEYVDNENDRITIAIAVYRDDNDHEFTFEVDEIGAILKLSKQGVYNLSERILDKLRRRAKCRAIFPNKADLILRELQDHYA